MSVFLTEDGKIIPFDEARIPAADRGFLFGEGLVETLLAVGPQIVDFYSHIERLRESAAAWNLMIPWSDQQLLFDMHAVALRIPDHRKRIKLIVTCGNGEILGENPARANRYILGSPAAPPLKSHSDRAIRLQRLTHPAPGAGIRRKTLSFQLESHSIRTARNCGFDDVLWTREDGEILECSTANVFFLGRIGDQIEIVTPPVQRGILPGTTRKKVIELLAEQGIPVEERIVHFEELPRFDEAFASSSVRGVVAINAIENHAFFSSRERATFRLVFNLYQLWLEKELNIQPANLTEN